MGLNISKHKREKLSWKFRVRPRYWRRKSEQQSMELCTDRHFYFYILVTLYVDGADLTYSEYMYQA